MKNQGHRPQFSLFHMPDPGDRLETRSQYSRDFDEDFPDDPDRGKWRRAGCVIMIVGSLIIWGLIYWFVIR